MKMQVYFVLLFIALVFIVGFHAKPMKFNAEDDSNDEMGNVKRGAIDPACTLSCTQWWWCRASGWFLKKCDKPAGCVCDQFAWEN